MDQVPKLYLEYKPNLFLLHIVVFLDKQLSKIELKRCLISITHKDTSKKYRFSSKLKILPNSCHRLSLHLQDGLHVYFKVDENEQSKFLSSKSVSSSSVGPQLLKVKQCITDRFLAFLKDKDVDLLCQRCGHTIMEKRFKNGIHKLPSDFWEEMAETAFCHDHENVSLSDGTSGHSEFYLKERQLLMHQDFLLTKHVEVTDKNLIKCTRCKKVVGRCLKGSKNLAEINLEDIEIYNKRILGQDSLQSAIKNPYRCIESLCDYIVKESDNNHSYRLLVEVPGLKKAIEPYLCLWILESNIEQYSTFSCDTKNPVDLQNIEPIKVVKFLYNQCFQGSNKELGLKWRRDMGTHSITIPLATGRHLLQTLASSTKKLPPSMRLYQQFYVGCLPRQCQENINPNG